MNQLIFVNSGNQADHEKRNKYFELRLSDSVLLNLLTTYQLLKMKHRPKLNCGNRLVIIFSSSFNSYLSAWQFLYW